MMSNERRPRRTVDDCQLEDFRYVSADGRAVAENLRGKASYLSAYQCQAGATKP